MLNGKNTQIQYIFISIALLIFNFKNTVDAPLNNFQQNEEQTGKKAQNQKIYENYYN
jgi:hypothetical protein